MKIIKRLRNCAGNAFALVALIVAQTASTQFSYIFYERPVPEKVTALKKLDKRYIIKSIKKIY